MANSFDPTRTVQLDVVKLNEPPGFVTCNLYTPDRCVRMTMAIYDYEDLVRDGFFIRDGKTPDSSAWVWNTTRQYAESTPS